MLQQLVHEEGSQYPLASNSIMNHTYIDDVITGADNSKSAVVLLHQLNSLMTQGGFALRKFATNHPEILEGIPNDHCKSPLIFSDGSKSFKILGLCWEQFHVSVPVSSRTYHKRKFALICLWHL